MKLDKIINILLVIALVFTIVNSIKYHYQLKKFNEIVIEVEKEWEEYKHGSN